MGMMMLLVRAFFGMDEFDGGWLSLIGTSLWTRWHEFARDHPEEGFRPKRIADEDTMFEVLVMACAEPDWPGMCVIHPWRVEKLTPNDQRTHPRIYLQPPPYDMAPTLEAARGFLPASATRLEGVPFVERYAEAWLA